MPIGCDEFSNFFIDSPEDLHFIFIVAVFLSVALSFDLVNHLANSTDVEVLTGADVVKLVNIGGSDADDFLFQGAYLLLQVIVAIIVITLSLDPQQVVA